MSIKVSEKMLFLSIALLAVGLFLFFTAKLTYVPVKVSEIGLLANVTALAFLIFGISLFARAIQKV
jgi:hypothetical protein